MSLDFGADDAKKAQRAQMQLIQKQRQVDELALAEGESEIARRKALTKSGQGGRSLLIKTSETGTKANNLGGTT